MTAQYNYPQKYPFLSFLPFLFPDPFFFFFTPPPPFSLLHFSFTPIICTFVLILLIINYQAILYYIIQTSMHSWPTAATMVHISHTGYIQYCSCPLVVCESSQQIEIREPVLQSQHTICKSLNHYLWLSPGKAKICTLSPLLQGY